MQEKRGLRDHDTGARTIALLCNRPIHHKCPQTAWGDNYTQHSDIQHNDTQHNGLICDTKHN
jgi:hypothetical protein